MNVVSARRRCLLSRLLGARASERVIILSCGFNVCCDVKICYLYAIALYTFQLLEI